MTTNVATDEVGISAYNNTVSTDATCTGKVSTETKVSVTNSRTFSISSGTYTVVVNRGSSSNPLPYSSGTAVTFTSYNYAYSGTWTYTSTSTSPESSTVSVAPTNATQGKDWLTIATNPFKITSKYYSEVGTTRNQSVTFTASTTVNGVAANLSSTVYIYQNGRPLTITSSGLENIAAGYPTGMETLVVELSNGEVLRIPIFEGNKNITRITVDGATYKDGSRLVRGQVLRVYYTLADYGIRNEEYAQIEVTGEEGGAWGGK